MEDLIAQFTLLSDHALSDKSFDPSAIEDLMKLFEVESYNAWAAMELNCSQEVEEAQNTVQEAEDYFESAMESAMEEFRRFEEEMDMTAAEELCSLVQIGDAARRFGNSMEKAAAAASEKYVGAAMSSAVASMRSAWKSVSSSSQKAKDAAQLALIDNKKLMEISYCDYTNQFHPTYNSDDSNSGVLIGAADGREDGEADDTNLFHIKTNNTTAEFCFDPTRNGSNYHQNVKCKWIGVTLQQYHQCKSL